MSSLVQFVILCLVYVSVLYFFKGKGENVDLGEREGWEREGGDWK